MGPELHYVVQESTNFPSGNIIDLCLVTNENRVGTCDVLHPFPNCSHGLIKVLYTFQDLQQYPEHHNDQRAPKKVWTRADFAGMKNHINVIDLPNSFAGLSVESQYQELIGVYAALEERYVPSHEQRNKLNVPWTLNPPRALKKEVSDAWNEYKTVRRGGRG